MLSILGISHKTASVSLRERLSFSSDELEKALLSLKKLGKDAEYLILSTCNRTEIYTTLDDMSILLHWLGDYHEISVSDFSAHLYSYHGMDAASHLMHVACGLDSMVLGEPQILGQIKDAFAVATHLETLGYFLTRAFTLSFSCAKAVRSKTHIGQCPVSVAYSAVKLGGQHLDLSKAKIGLIGAGKTAELLLKHLISITPADIIIFNRTLSTALSLAKKYKLQGRPINSLSEALSEIDLVLCAASDNRHYLIHPGMFQQNTHSENNINKPLTFIDISVPRCVDPAIKNLNQAHSNFKSNFNRPIQIFSLDDINTQIEKNILFRTQASLEASDLITEHVEAYQAQINAKIASPYIANYRAYGEKIRDAEIAKAECLLARGVEPNLIIQSLAHHLTSKLIHRPTKNLSQAGAEGEIAVLEFAQKLFKLV